MTALSDTAARPGLRLVSFKAVRKGTLVGFATVELPIGLTIIDCPICFSNGKAWATPPGKLQTDKDGQPIRNERGKLAYSQILEWRNRRLRDAFSERVVELVRKHDPGALADGIEP
jgi:hypothetical protein